MEKLNIKEFLLSAVFPSRCAACGEIIPFDAKKTRTCFCDACVSDFVLSVRDVCPICGESYAVCECVPELLRVMGIASGYSCFAYDKSNRKSASSKLIFKLKSGKDREVMRFCAEMLASRLEKAAITSKIELGDYIVTYAPRRNRAIRENGCDHMKITAKLTAKRLGLPFEAVFVNTAREAQKAKDAASRIEGAEAIRPKRSACEKICGKRYILLDDILTSGATVASCAASLFECGAEDVLVCILSKTKST